MTKGRSAETAPYRQTTVAANSAKTTKRDFLIFITDDMGYINIVNVESLFLMHTTIPSHNGMVLTSPYHGSDEVEENKRIGAFVAKKLERRFIYYQDLTPEAANSHT